jgi:molecular chaperone GrpE
MKKNAEHESAEETASGGEPIKAAKAAPDGKTAAPGPDAAANETADETAAGEPGAAASPLEARIAELEKTNAELQDQYLRKAADFDNYRKRMIKEKQDAVDFANSNLLVDLVEILDNFDRAIAAIGEPEAGTPGASFKDGISMIRTQMGTMLESKYGLTYYPSKGASFDPNVHEAIGSTANPEVKEATVAEEFVKGYKLKDRIIRHAKVMVHTPA